MSQATVDETGMGGYEYKITKNILAATKTPGVEDLTTEALSGDDGLTLADTLGDYDAALDEVENHEALRPLLEALPARERTVVLLRFFGNMTQTQIAERVGVSQMHVSRLLTKTLAQLREQLGDNF